MHPITSDNILHTVPKLKYILIHIYNLMDQPFIYKYRPQQLDEFEIDAKTIDLLKVFININNLNLLLVGDSGCGKTSLINCIIKEYYGADYNSMNILTINSLKDQGVSYYRSEVKTFCQTMCTTQGKKKFIILDDIDTLNDQSQQVFRNFIDKYSNNVHFIASCTNTQKVIDSIQSRIVIIKIKGLNVENLERVMDQICEKEHIVLTTEVKQFVLSICNNSIRTIINYLEKFKLINQAITHEIAINCCTNISFDDFARYTVICKSNKNDNMSVTLREAIAIIYFIYDMGYSVMDILDNYFLFIKTTNLLTESQKFQVIKLLCKYITIFYNIHEDEIELALFTNNLIHLMHGDSDSKVNS